MRSQPLSLEARIVAQLEEQLSLLEQKILRALTETPAGASPARNKEGVFP